VARAQCAYEIFRLFNAPKDSMPFRSTEYGCGPAFVRSPQIPTN